jgi:hypothetical protein
VSRYGTTSTVKIAEQICLWFGTWRTDTVRVILVKNTGRATKTSTTNGYDIALITTDLAATAAEIIARYAARWAIEVTFFDVKNILGAGEARNRTTKAVERTVPFGLLCHSILIIWYALHGHDQDDAAGRRACAPWYRTKTSSDRRHSSRGLCCSRSCVPVPNDDDRAATSGEASRADDGVDAGAGHSARAVLGDDELPAGGVERSDRLVDGDLHLTGRGSCGSGGRVDRAVTDQEQGPAERDPRRHPFHHLLHRPRHVDVQAGDEVVVARLWGPGREIALDPGDALGDVRPDGLGRRPGMSQGGRGEVDRGDLPSARGEPERVGPVTTARVEGDTGTQVPDCLGQMGVRRALRDCVPVLTQGLRPAFLPEVPVERRGHDVTLISTGEFSHAQEAPGPPGSPRRVVRRGGFVTALVTAAGVAVEDPQDLGRSAGGADGVREHRGELRSLVGLDTQAAVPE